MSQLPSSPRRLTNKPGRWMAAIALIAAAIAAMVWYAGRSQRVDIPIESVVAPARPAAPPGTPARIGLTTVVTGDSLTDQALAWAADRLGERLSGEPGLEWVPMPPRARCGGPEPVQLCLEITPERTLDGVTLQLDLLDQRSHRSLTDYRTVAGTGVTEAEELRVFAARVALWSVPGALQLLDGPTADLGAYRNAVRAFTSCDPAGWAASRTALQEVRTRLSQASSSAESAQVAPGQAVGRLLGLLEALESVQGGGSAPAPVLREARAMSPGVGSAMEMAVACLTVVNQR